MGPQDLYKGIDAGQYDALIAAAGILLLAFLVAFPRIRKHQKEQSIVQAKGEATYFASFEWRVAKREIYYNRKGKVTKVILVIQTFNYKQKYELHYSRSHPDIKKLEEVDKYDIIGFHLLVNPPSHMPANQTTSHLLLRTYK